MKYEKGICPICSTPSSIGVTDYGDKLEITCEGCGKYKISKNGLETSDLHLIKNGRSILSYYLRNFNESQEYLGREDINKIINNYILPEFETKYNNLLKWFWENSEHTTRTVDGFPNKLAAIIGAIDGQEVVEILDELWNEKLIEMENPGAGPLRDKYPFSAFAGHLTKKGIKSININNNLSPIVYNYKKHILTNDEKLLLAELAKNDFEVGDARSIKVKLLGKISSEFNIAKVDNRLIRSNRITLLGLWYIDPGNHLINKAHKVIEKIRDFIKGNPKLDSIDSYTIASSLNISENDVKIIFSFLADFGFCSGGSTVQGDKYFCSINFSKEADGFDKILNYKNIDDALEYFFNNQPRGSYLSDVPSLQKKMKKIVLSDDVWSDIYAEYKISKRAFGKKIRFVKDKYKRNAIFRDVEDAFILYKNGFPKSAIILSGGVIEELLRLYLIHKDLKPGSNRFVDYIKVCESNKLLEISSRLSDLARHFRNYVHLEREVDVKTSLSQSMASGVVASIFTIVSDF